MEFFVVSVHHVASRIIEERKGGEEGRRTAIVPLSLTFESPARPAPGKIEKSFSFWEAVPMKTPLLCDPVARLGRFKQSNVVNVDRIMLSNKVRQANPCSEIVKSAWCSNLSRMLKLVFEQGWASLGPLRRQTQEPVHTPLPKVLHLSKRCVGGAIWSISGDRQCASAQVHLHGRPSAPVRGRRQCT